GLHLVREEERDELSSVHRVCRGRDRQPGLFGRVARAAALAEPDDHVDTGVVQVERMGVTLAAVAEDGHLAGEQPEVAVAENCCHEWILSYLRTCWRRLMPCRS